MIGLGSRKIMAWLALFAYLLLWHGQAHGAVFCTDPDGRNHLEMRTGSGCLTEQGQTDCRPLWPGQPQLSSFCRDFAPDFLAYQRTLSPSEELPSPLVSDSTFRWSFTFPFPSPSGAGWQLPAPAQPRLALVALKTVVLRH